MPAFCSSETPVEVELDAPTSGMSGSSSSKGRSPLIATLSQNQSHLVPIVEVMVSATAAVVTREGWIVVVDHLVPPMWHVQAVQ